ncbi:hypothetical protein E2C01_097836 [Portunus trituberculatus]|uniref:Uncharacterized protein n=1 Tax=Portunus trituberculatus TaxID=210409 RepID=A0A5B7K1E0_PORTR|nr:hypothetical protein [Portunus trituberculatus]
MNGESKHEPAFITGEEAEAGCGFNYTQKLAISTCFSLMKGGASSSAIRHTPDTKHYSSDVFRLINN